MKTRLQKWADEWQARQAAVPPLSPRNCENYLAQHHANSSPQMIQSCRRELARTCRVVRREKGREAARSLHTALRRYVWLPFERLREESQANRAAATRRRIEAKRAAGLIS